MSDQPKLATLKVIARAPFKVYYDGDAYSLSAENKVGAFDILPGHADFFSMLSPCVVTIQTAGEPVEFNAHSGMITVKHDEIMLFVNM